jgi:hypothetical protein
MEVADQQPADGESVAASTNALKVKRCIPQVELLHDGRWPGKVAAAAGWKVLFVSRAAHRRNDHVKSVSTDQMDPVPQQKKIDPTPFHTKMGDRTDRRKVARRVAAEGDAIGYESRMGKVSAVVTLNLDFAGKYSFEEWLDIPVSKWPVQVHESNA